MVLVLQRVEEALAVGCPDCIAAGVLDHVGKVLAGLEIADLQREIFRALVVIAPDAMAVVGGMVETGKAEIGFSFVLLVAVQKQLALATVARLAEEAGLFAAGDEKRAIGIGAVLHRYRAVVFLDAALHLAEENLLQFLRVRHRSVHVGVLGFQMRPDFRRQDRRVLEHCLPVVGAQPRIVVGAGNAVTRVREGLFRGGGRSGEILEN